MIRRERLTPRALSKRTNISVSPQNHRLKSKKKENLPTQRRGGKQNHEGDNSKDQYSLKICLDLANYHRKDAEQFKVKNQVLQQRLKDQLQDMESLRKELNDIKVSLQDSYASKKEIQILRVQNVRIKNENENMRILVTGFEAKVSQLTTQNSELRSKARQTQSVLMVGESKCDNYDINTLTLAKQSRRQHYANNYQSFTFVPSAACLQCSKRESQLQQARGKYCNELRQLREQVNSLQRSQLTIEVMQRQMMGKNECIDFLMHQLGVFESDSRNILENMALLQRKLQELTIQNSIPKGYTSDRLCHSFSKTIA